MGYLKNSQPQMYIEAMENVMKNPSRYKVMGFL